MKSRLQIQLETSLSSKAELFAEKQGNRPNRCEQDQKPSIGLIKYGRQNVTQLSDVSPGCLCRQKHSY